MKGKIIRKCDYKVSKWSGGTTSELFIYPQNAEYINRDFLFRISSATIMDNESIFTKLKDVKRHLMVISGELKLVYENRYSKDLKDFEQDIFDGGWNTTSYSCNEVTDFNLMTKEGCNGHISLIELTEKAVKHLISKKNKCETIECFYTPFGSIIIELEKNIYELNEGDMFLIVVHKNEILDIKISSKDNKDIKIIETSITFE